jgi:hypothetical protein
LEGVREIKTAKATLSLIKRDIVRILVDEEVDVQREDILEINAAKNSLIGNGKYCVVFITPKFGSINSEARAVSASKEVYHNAIAKAIVVPNLGQRIIGSFFIKFNKPPSPTRLFSNEADAVIWLENMKETYFEKNRTSVESLTK